MKLRECIHLSATKIWPHLSENCPQKMEHLHDEFPTLREIFASYEVVGANERTGSNSGHHTLLEPLQTCQQRHMGFVHCCAYERGNGVVATGGGDGRIFFWTEQHQVWKGGSIRSGQKRVKHLGKLTGLLPRCLGKFEQKRLSWTALKWTFATPCFSTNFSTWVVGRCELLKSAKVGKQPWRNPTFLSKKQIGKTSRIPTLLKFLCWNPWDLDWDRPTFSVKKRPSAPSPMVGQC